MLDLVPAWLSNRLSRLAKTGERYLVDPSLAAAALRSDEAAVMRDGNLLGRLIDTFTVAQIRPELELAPFRPRLHHLRSSGGRHEIDLIAELPAGDIVAIEIRSSAAPGRHDARHPITDFVVHPKPSGSNVPTCRPTSRPAQRARSRRPARRP